MSFDALSYEIDGVEYLIDAKADWDKSSNSGFSFASTQIPAGQSFKALSSNQLAYIDLVPNGTSSGGTVNFKLYAGAGVDKEFLTSGSNTFKSFDEFEASLGGYHSDTAASYRADTDDRRTNPVRMVFTDQNISLVEGEEYTIEVTSISGDKSVLLNFKNGYTDGSGYRNGTYSAFDFAFHVWTVQKENFLIGKPAIQSSDSNSQLASLAVDGDMGTTSSTTLENSAWWQVNLEAEVYLSSITISSGDEAAQNVRIELLSSDFSVEKSYSLTQLQAGDNTFNFDEPVSAQYIKVINNGEGLISLSEVSAELVEESIAE
jgi:hypothetical protein